MMSFLKWGFRSNVRVIQNEKDSVELSPKKKFSDFIKELPSISQGSFWLDPRLFNGTLQTMKYANSNQPNKHKVYYGRELFTYEDGGICSADFVIPPESDEEFKKNYQDNQPEDWPKLHPRTRFLSKAELAVLNEPSEDTRPICVVFHGLAGGSHEVVVRALAEKLYGKGWAVVVLNNRGCGRTKITTPKLFSALSTDDLKEFVYDLKERFPNRKLFAVGLSFGAALLANYLGKESDHKISGAACVCCPWDLTDSGYHLESSWTGAYLFSPAISSFMCKLIKNSKKELESVDYMDFSKLKEIKKIYQFDRYFTAPSVGLRTPFEYYRAASPVNTVMEITTPLLMLNSKDDPTVGVNLPWMEVEKNPYLALIETDLGGHLGFFKPNGESWAIELVEEYLSGLQETLN